MNSDVSQLKQAVADLGAAISAEIQALDGHLARENPDITAAVQSLQQFQAAIEAATQKLA